MEPANTIITKLGGASAVARAAGVHPSRVYYWTYPRSSGGADGQIPQRHIPALLKHAKEIDVDLSVGDFFCLNIPPHLPPTPSTPDSALPAVCSMQHMGD